MATNKKKKWIRFRHKIVRNLLYPFIVLLVKIKYGVKVQKFENQGHKQYLILSNHQTAYDQFLVTMAFKGTVYYVASEDIFSLGFISKLLKFLVAPIPIKKQATDVSAVLTCKRVVKEGGTIAIFPEGNRTYSGKTEYMNPAIASLAKLLKLPIAFLHIEGGYGVHPRWSDVVRKGSKINVHVSKVMEVEDYIDLDNDTLNDLIKKELFVDETKYTTINNHKKQAEYLERVIYVCPKCGVSEFVSSGDSLECKRCGLKVLYLSNKKLKAVNGDIPFEYVNDWYEYQIDYVNTLDLLSYKDKPIFADSKAKVFEVILYKKKRRLASKANITAYKDKFIIDYQGEKIDLTFDDLSVVTVLGKNKLNVYSNCAVYQIKGDKRFNAVKYVHLYHHYKNVKEGKANGRFLGL